MAGFSRINKYLLSIICDEIVFKIITQKTVSLLYEALWYLYTYLQQKINLQILLVLGFYTR